MAKTEASNDTFLTRGEFIGAGAAALLAFSSVGCLMGCATKKDEEGSGKNFSGTLTLSAAQKTTLDSQGFLNLDEGLIVVKDGTIYHAFGRRCPHEGGTVTGQSATSLQCQTHSDQVYNKLGQGNGARTSASLVSYTVTDNSGTLTITG